MIKSYSLEDVAAAHLPAEWKDGVHWLKRRLKSGEIPGKQINRGVWRMTDADIEALLMSRGEQATPECESTPVTSIADGLSMRSRSRALGHP